MKKLGAPILAFVFLLVSVSSLLIFVQGDSGGTTSYEIFEDFENMETYADIEAFFPQFEFDEDSSVTLSLSETGGYLGSKAAKIDCSPLAYYLNILDKENVTNRFHTKGEGFSFWLKTEQPTRFKLRILEDWNGYEGEVISVDAGEHFIRIPWSSVKFGENALATNPENKIMRLRLEFLNNGDSGFLTNTLYIDEIGYYSDAEPTTSEPTTSEPTTSSPTTTAPAEPSGPAVPDQPYGIYQNFESMNTQEHLDNFMMAAIDEDSQMTLTLSEDGGYQNSKAAKIEYNRIADWMNFLDENYQAQHYTASGDGFSFWIKTSNEIRIRLYVFDAWLEMYSDYVTLSPGEHFVQFPWNIFKGTDGDGNEVPLTKGSENTIQMIKIQVSPVSSPGTIYIDEIGYINYEPPVTTTKPTLPEGESVVLFCATRGASPWPNIQGDPAFCNIFRVEDDPRFNFYFKFSLLEDFSRGGMFIYNNLSGEGGLSPADISYAYEKGYVRFWVKASAAKSFGVYFSAEGEVPSARTTVTVNEPNVWQEVRIPMSTFTFSKMSHAEKVYHFCISGKDVEGEAFGAGDVIKIAGIKVYSQDPEEIEVEDGLDNDPEDISLLYPVGTEDDSDILWFTDPSAAFDLSGGAGDVTVEDESVLEGFDKVFKWVLGEEFKTAYRGLYLYGDSADISDYINTGYLRFYVKASRVGKIMLALNDDAYNYGPRHIVEIDRANEWIEVRIPLSRFIGFQDIEYISAIFISDVYKPYSWSFGDNYEGEVINSGEGYLQVGDTLYLSPFIIQAGTEVTDNEDNDNDVGDNDNDGKTGDEDGTKTPNTGVNSSIPLAVIPLFTLLISVAAYLELKRYSRQ